MIFRQRINNLVLIRGGGDIASGIAHRLFLSGFRVVILETEYPTHIRRSVSFAQAVYDKHIQIEAVTARLVSMPEHIKEVLNSSDIPVIIDAEGSSIVHLKPDVVVDAILAKRNLGTSINMAPVVIGIGPGFCAGVDVHAVVETNRGHFLGSVILKGEAQKDTGIPGIIEGISEKRVLRASVEGDIEPLKNIGDRVKKREVIAIIGKKTVRAGIPGIIRGLLNPGIHVSPGYKIGDIDPRNEPDYCYYISDKSRAIGGGVLETILRLGQTIR